MDKRKGSAARAQAIDTMITLYGFVRKPQMGALIRESAAKRITGGRAPEAKSSAQKPVVAEDNVPQS
jgi:hypothetical protein